MYLQLKVIVQGRELWETFVSPSDNRLHYFISYAVAFAAFGCIAKWYLWPAIKVCALKTAFTPLLLGACFRVNRLMFLIPRLVLTQLQKPFANTVEIAGCPNARSRTAIRGIECV